MDLPPPAMHQHVGAFSQDFLNFVKSIENDARVGFKDGKWYPHKSYEGELPTIAWGHKLRNEAEVRKYAKGISEAEAERLLMDDLQIAQKEVQRYMQKRGVKIPLSQRQYEMLTEFAFNLGTLDKFPKFTKAVLNQDWKTAEKESIRYSKGKPLERRNKMFKQRYFK